FPCAASGDTSEKPDAFEADDDDQHDPAAVETRLSVLRHIGMKANPGPALRHYLLKKVATGKKENPWLSCICTEKSLRKKLRRYMLGMMIQACKDEGVEECQLDSLHEDAFKFIDRLNEELIQSLAAVGTFSTEQMRCARSNCQKAFLPRKMATTLVSRINGDYTECQVKVFQNQNVPFKCARMLKKHWKP
ncbi:unnamed protein product, partial [Strongylus vulgaris]